LARQLPVFDGQPDGTAEQTHADDRYLPEKHMAKIADGEQFVNR
jgi:hypothetical protein